MNWQSFVRGRAPPVSKDLPKLRRSRPFDQRHDLVPRQMAHEVRQKASGLVMQMMVRVPAAGDNVGAATKRESVVNHHQLLMVTRPKGDGGVQLKADPRPSEPTPGALRVAAVGGRDCEGRVPHQNADVQLGFGVRKPHQDVADFVGIVRPFMAIRGKPRAGIEAPPEDMDRPLRGFEGRGKRVIVDLSIDEEPDPSGSIDLTTVVGAFAI